MREAECGGGEDGALREREKDFAEDAEASGSEKLCLFKKPVIDGVEAGGERLDGEGQAVDHRTDHEPREREGERMAEEVGDGSSDGRPRAEEDEEIESEDGGRKQNGERGDGFDERSEARAGGGDPAGDGNGEDEQHRGGDGGETEGEGESLEIHLWNGLEAFGGEFLGCAGLVEEVEEAVRGRCVCGVADDDRALQERRVVVSGDADEVAVVSKARRKRGGERDKSDLGIRGVSVLRGLGDILGDHEFRAEGVEEMEVLEGGLRRSSVGRVFWIGDGDRFDRGCRESLERKSGDAGIVAGPKNEGAAGVGDGLGFFGAAGADDALRKRGVGGKEEIEGGAVDDFGGEGGRGLVGGFCVDAGLLFEGDKEGWQERLQVGGGSDAEGLGLRGGEGREEESQQ